MTEKVILVDQTGQKIGEADKAQVHTDQTPLHLAFSCFLFNAKGEFMIQQRAETKKTWPNVWSNTCCGHPALGELTDKAVIRRIKEELGIIQDQVELILPDFRYHARHLGVVENEICPVYVGMLSSATNLNPEEVQAVDLVDWGGFIRAILDKNDTTFDHFSVWCRTEAMILHHNQKFRAFYEKNIGEYPDFVLES